MNLLSVATAFVYLLGQVATASDNKISNLVSVTIPEGTIIGSSTENVDYFRGIPYAEHLRLRPPQRATSLGTVQATGIGPACPQYTNLDSSPLLERALSEPGFVETAFIAKADGAGTEDCLTVSVMRPAGLRADADLPVLFWIHGGGFEIGTAQPFNGSVLIPRSVQQGKPMIVVAINYRLSGFGFLGGKEVLKDGAANLGLLDQRMALEWVADNIRYFGGDPDKVTIIGESSGAMSVFNQLGLYAGNYTYSGRPLFRAAVMHSGSMLPADAVDGEKAQRVFDTVVHAGGCETAENKLDCLRRLDFQAFNNAVNSVPGFMSYSSVAFSYQPRPDGKVLTDSADILVRDKKLTAVPIIIGDMADEGTIFALHQNNVTNKTNVISYLKDVFFKDASLKQLTDLVDTYDHCPYNPPCKAENPYPEYQRMSTIIGDTIFSMMRRHLLTTMSSRSGNSSLTPMWSFVGTWANNTPLLGTYHTSDMIQLFYGTQPYARAMQDRYIAFIHCLDPNKDLGRATPGFDTNWPQWNKANQLLELGARGTRLITDSSRAESFRFIHTHLHVLRQ